MTKPRLLAISGSINGSEFVLEKAATLIGRDKSNEIRIADRSISRRHSLVKIDGSVYTAVDLDSFNGMFVNGVAVKESNLKHGDRLTLGDISFLFFETEDTRSFSAFELASDINGGSTVRLARRDALYLSAARFDSTSANEDAARHLASLVEFSVLLSKVRDLESLQNVVFDSIFPVIPAERGAILLIDESLDNIKTAYGRWRLDRDENRPVRVSRTIADQVIGEKTALLCHDVQGDAAFNSSESLISARTDSVLCVPLTNSETVVGLIYLDSSDRQNVFETTHLEFLTAVAAIVSVVLENIAHLAALASENQRLRDEIELQHNMVGGSPPMERIFRFIEKAAPTDATILVRGESGTGKELVAHALHENSVRAERPFVAINCAVLNENLLESELFGHERGAFTTAVAQKKGKLEIADGGTLFLDELGEMTPATQAKLLRFLQEREFERVGGTKSIKVDVRVIAATNRDLEAEIKSGAFRQDLYYRLNVVSLTMPALRERREDISVLADYFVKKYAAKCGRKVTAVSAQAMGLLTKHDWPGNVRELENAIERAIVLGNSDVILPEDLPETILESTAAAAPAMEYQSAVAEMKKDLIVRTLERAGGNYAEAARILGLHPANLHRLIRTLGIKEFLR